jgi:hypothetical protein
MSWAAACSSSLAKLQQGLRNEAEAFGWVAVSSGSALFYFTVFPATMPLTFIFHISHVLSDCCFCLLRCCERRLICDVVET